MTIDENPVQEHSMGVTVKTFVSNLNKSQQNAILFQASKI